MEQLREQNAYPEGHMGNRVIEFERRYNNLFDGALRLQFIVPSDHVNGDGTVNVESLEKQTMALLAADDGYAPDADRVRAAAERLAERIREKTGGCAMGADDLNPKAKDAYSSRGIIYPGTKNFRSGALLSAYSRDHSYNGQVYKGGTSNPAMHLDRVMYHEMGHRVQHFLDHKTHPLSDQCSLPMEMGTLMDDDAAFEKYSKFRDENYADGFMALMMVRDHGDAGRDYAEVIAHTRGLGFENGIHCYYTTKTIQGALDLAEELGDELHTLPVEDLAVKLFHRQHEVMWGPQEFINNCDQQAEFCRKVLDDEIEQADMPKYRWLLEMRDTHEDALMRQMRHPQAYRENHPQREALLDDYFDESAAALDFVWETDEQKCSALYAEKVEIRSASKKSITFYDEDELAKVTLDQDEYLEVNADLNEEYTAENVQAKTVKER